MQVLIRFGILLVSIWIMLGCHDSKQVQKRSLLVKNDSIVYLEGQSFSTLTDFLHQNPMTMLGFLEADCCSCIIGLNSWLKFQEKYPDLTLLLIVNTQQSKKHFWTLLKEYYPNEFYVFFDTKHKLFRENHFQHETVIVDSVGSIILEDNIANQSFEKEYIKNMRLY